ncbi:MAG TPA: DnaJ domain-containing protein [Ktedonobacteraceae bacterium]|jgi:curved DNA-binding protein CbpA|nr:DnaJ domain-containing protein [Ktedonobacteraceae bacterium]
MPDYYKILEVPPTASMEEIKRSYHRLARMHHPDLNQHALDIHIKRLNQAYEIIGNPAKRAQYDAQREAMQRRADARANLHRQQKEQAKKQEPEMTWIEGIFGFVKELRRNLKEDV